MSRSIRQHVMFSSSLIIIALAIVNLFTIAQAYITVSKTQSVFTHLSRTTSISQKLTDTHQDLRKVILYSNFENDFATDFRIHTEELLELTESTEALIKQISEQMGYINIYYNYQAISNMIRSYTEMGKAILAQKDSGSDQVELLNSLYHLRDTQSSINESLSAILFQQQLFANKNLDETAAAGRRQLLLTIGLSVLLYLSIILATGRLVDKISRPIHLLAEASENIQRGIYEPLPIRTYQIKDFNVLIRTFNDMTSTIARSIQHLKEKAELEYKLRKEETKNLQIANTLHTAQIQVMQNQINPHFLFNTLNIIVSLARIEGATKTRALLQDVSSIIRYGLKKSNNFSTIKEEMEIVDTYIRIQQVRYEDKISYISDIDQGLYRTRIPAMILQPLVENSIIHGLEQKMGPGTIEVTISTVDDEQIAFSIKDDGIGMSPKDLQGFQSALEHLDDYSYEKGKHGLLNVLYRIHLVYPLSSITIDSAQGEGTSIRFTLPEH